MSRRARSFAQFENPGATVTSSGADISAGGVDLGGSSSAHTPFQNVKDEHSLLFNQVKSLTSKFMEQVCVYEKICVCVCVRVCVLALRACAVGVFVQL